MKTPRDLLTKTYSKKNHGINAHLKPRVYFVDYDDAVRAMKEFAKQWVDEMAKDLEYTPLYGSPVDKIKDQIDAQ